MKLEATKTIAVFFGLMLRDITITVRDLWIRASYRSVGVKVSRDAMIRTAVGCEVQIGRGSTVGRGSVILATNEGAVGHKSLILVGENTAINEYCNIRASGVTILVGNNCLFAQFVSVLGSNHRMLLGKPMKDQPWDLDIGPIKVGDDVWLGAGVTILPGVTIGRGAVVGAGAVVNRDVPAFEIWAGVPARKIGIRDT